MTIRFKRLARTLLCAAGFLFVASCSTPKDVTYFQDASETVVPLAGEGHIEIEPGDRLSIIVKSKDPALSELYNLTVNTNRLGMASVSPEGMSSYIVGKDGMIDFPVLGSMKVAGMTRSELAGFITGELRAGHVRDAVVSVELLNASFSVMGEVKQPGRIPIDKERLTILEALSLAGDLDIQGRRDNVSVIRQEEDGVHTYRIDLTNMRDVAQSPAYYIKQDDVIYVEPNDVKKRQTTVNGNNVLSWGFWVSVASLLTSIAVLIVK